MTARAGTDRDGEAVFDPKGEAREFESGRINWFGRDPEWADRLGFRGRQDVESPLGQWTRLEVIADGDRVTNLVNGTVVNGAPAPASPRAGSWSSPRGPRSTSGESTWPDPREARVELSHGRTGRRRPSGRAFQGVEAEAAETTGGLGTVDGPDDPRFARVVRQANCFQSIFGSKTSFDFIISSQVTALPV